MDPNIEITSPDRIVVPLVEDYKFESMSYLDTLKRNLSLRNKQILLLRNNQKVLLM